MRIVSLGLGKIGLKCTAGCVLPCVLHGEAERQKGKTIIVSEIDRAENMRPDKHTQQEVRQEGRKARPKRFTDIFQAGKKHAITQQ